MYVCIDILEHSTISVAITAQSLYQVYSMQEHKSYLHTVHSTTEPLTYIYTGLYQQTHQSLCLSNTSLALVALANLVGGN